MAWMEPFLEAGEIAGKIICPNKKCGAKLGNYDWAGVKCGCKEWVIPVRLSFRIPIRLLTTISGILHKPCQSRRDRRIGLYYGTASLSFLD